MFFDLKIQTQLHQAIQQHLLTKYLLVLHLLQ